MKRHFYTDLAQRSIDGHRVGHATCRDILDSDSLELLPLLDAAFQVRKIFWNNEVQIHIINNAQNGHCPEDCHYCAQAKTSAADIQKYTQKSDTEILKEAKEAYASGAFRYCLVYAGRAPSSQRIDHIAKLVQKIKAAYPLQVCVSAGLIDAQGAKKLKDAGLDRLNHNLNTSANHYKKICTTHSYQDRINTLNAACHAGLNICSGMIVGMGETSNDIIDVARQLRTFKAPSIPINFLVPIKGNSLQVPDTLTPEYCLRILCLFRFLNPRAEIRVAAGREGHLRSMEVMALYPANSIFMEGYLNTKGHSRQRTLDMIQDAGFTIKTDRPLDQIHQKREYPKPEFSIDGSNSIMKTLSDLRPAHSDTI